LGSTGSIGTQALEVAAQHPERLRVTVLTAQRNWELLAQQALQWQPELVVIADEAGFAPLREALSHTAIRVASGPEALCEAAAWPLTDVVLTAVVGFAGLRPTMAAIEAGKTLAIANKETLVVAGEVVMAAAAKAGVRILPVDSEHSALYQCLVGEDIQQVQKLILTASGGPFRGRVQAELAHVTREQALRHPNWSMGAKITIDSASLMNKGLEVIETRWLFGLPLEQIDVVVHPQSILHSLVEFHDGTLKAQMGTPDMRLPIQYALSGGQRWANDFPRFHFAAYPQLTFEAPDRDTFRALPLAYEALRRGGNAPCVLNAANEVAVAAFLSDSLSFLGIYDHLERALAAIPHIPKPTLTELLQTDAATRELRP
jgi:1-deoxy-D-xylulose-5-phosphate reductoisomerase